MESKVKHLEFIQAVIARMSSNSFLLKGWAVTLVVALFAFTSTSANAKFIIVAFLPVVMFWLLSGYFLWQERLFIALYNEVRTGKGQDDFSMGTEKFCGGRNTWLRSTFSTTLSVFYLTLVVIMALIIYIL